MAGIILAPAILVSISFADDQGFDYKKQPLGLMPIIWPPDNPYSAQKRIWAGCFISTPGSRPTALSPAERATNQTWRLPMGWPSQQASKDRKALAARPLFSTGPIAWPSSGMVAP